MKQAFKWLSRRIAHPGPYLTLCLTEDEFKLAMKHCNIQTPSPWIKTDHADATCHHLFNDKGAGVAVVAVRGWEGRDPVELAGLLVHEAVHIWQEYCDRIGETAPAREQEAYAIQAISQELMAEFARRIKGL